MTAPGPGAAHPEPPLPVAAMAARLRVPQGTLRGWIDAGLPTVDGQVDPFAALTWASWAGDDAPVVRARWRRYVGWMLGPAGRQPRRLRVQRVHRCHLDRPAAGVWWLPPLAADANQRTAATPWEPLPVDDVRSPQVREHTVHLVPGCRGADPWLLSQVRAVAGEFRYGYRHHQTREGVAPEHRSAGTCIDAVVALARRLADGGRPWRYVAGITTSDTFANTHWWIESDDVVLDPTIPAIARMAGMDWESLVAAACAGRDSRRIAFAPPDPRIAGMTLGGHAGAVIINGADGFACTDWACGQCGWRFR